MTELQITGEPSRGRLAIAGAWLMLAAGLALAFWSNFAAMWTRWFPAWENRNLGLYDRFVEGQSYYTHGPLIPLVSLLIVILLVRHVKISIRPRPILGGLALVLSLMMHLLACRARVNFASAFMFISVLASLVLMVWGAAAFRQLWFPIALLLFMVPLPEITIYQLNFRLKMFAAEWGVALAQAIGVIVERSGNRVFLEGDKSLIIANVCNGLRTLISLLAFGFLYAYVCRLRGLWRLGLFAATIPVAVISNSVRIVSLIVVADIWESETATGWFHDFSGLLIFVMAFMLMFSIERCVLWARRAVGRPATILPLFDGRLRTDQDEGQWSAMVAAVASIRGYVAGVCIMLAACGALWLNQAVVSNVTSDVIKEAVPRTLEIMGETYYGYDLLLDDRTLAILQNPSYVRRNYVRAGQPPTDFCVIFSKDNRKGTHPPDLCLEGGGAEIIAKGTILLNGVPGRPDIPLRELVVQIGRMKLYYVYTYKCGDRYTDSFWVQQSVIFVNGLVDRNASGALIRASTVIFTDIAAARERCAAVLRATIPYLDKNLP